jgi:hypothetical protein
VDINKALDRFPVMRIKSIQHILKHTTNLYLNIREEMVATSSETLAEAQEMTKVKLRTVEACLSLLEELILSLGSKQAKLLMMLKVSCPNWCLWSISR